MKVRINDSMKPLIKSKKFKLVVISVFVLILGVSLFTIFSESKKLNYLEDKQQVQSGAMSWLQALCDKDYSVCDTMSASDGFKFSGYDMTVESFASPIASEVYYQFLDFVVDSIQGIKILSITENVDTGYTEYEVEVTYIPYEKISSISVDEEKVNSIMKDYVDSALTDDEFREKIREYYFELFKTCFKLSSEEYVTSKVLTLSEKEDTNGVVYVYNTKTFIGSLISDEMYKNLEVYQNNIKAKVDTVLRQY